MVVTVAKIGCRRYPGLFDMTDFKAGIGQVDYRPKVGLPVSVSNPFEFQNIHLVF